MSQRVIANEISRSRIVIAIFLKDPDAHGTKNHTEYIGTLERPSLFTEGARLYGEDYIFQQNNDAIHTARR